MLMNRGAASEFVVHDGDIDGMELSPSPTRQSFGHLQLVDINKRQGHTPAVSLREQARSARVVAERRAIAHAKDWWLLRRYS